MTSYSGKIIRKTPVTPTQTSASGVWTTADAAAAVKNNLWPVPGVPDPISRSVRLRASASAYFSKTLTTPTNNKIFTWSGWIKRGALGSTYSYPNLLGTSSDEILFYSATYTDELAVNMAAGVQCNVITTQVFRDPSAWYHIIVAVDTTQATASNRVKIYVNGVQVTSFATATYPSLNYSPSFNSAVAHNIGNNTAGRYFDGYMTEVNFIDGQQLTASSFGTTNAQTGAWIPMPYTGTYGANGFYLNFKDNTSTTTLGYDYSGNANNWVANNISLTAGTTYDSMLDVPTSWIGYSATTDTTAVTRGNYAVLNPLRQNGSATFAQGNLAGTSESGTSRGLCSTIVLPRSDKWYMEWTPSSSATNWFGVTANEILAADINTAGQQSVLYYANGTKWVNGSNSAYGSSYTTQTIGIAFDGVAGTITFYRDNVSQGAISLPSSTVDYVFCMGNAGGGGVTNYANFGQRPFTYTPPTGYKALCTTNLPAPTIVNGASYMAASTFTGVTGGGSVVNNENAAAITFQPDFVWMKARNSANNHELADSVRGTPYASFSNLTNAEVSDTRVSAFNSNGFSYGTNSNSAVTGRTSVGWQWKAGGSAVANTNGTITSQVSANTTAGFSIATYTGTGSNATVGHGLGVAPSMIIVKDRTSGSRTVSQWPVYHASLGNTKACFLNSTDAAFTDSTYFNNTSPTSTVFSVGSWGGINYSSDAYVAYCFAAVTGYSAFGSYTGNGSADGPFIYCGFRPRYVMIKKSSAASTTYGWQLYDTTRSPYNTTALPGLWADTSAAEAANTYGIDILSNGFKIRDSNTNMNASGQTMIYAAFAENPFNYSNAR